MDLVQEAFNARAAVRLHTVHGQRLEKNLRAVDALAVCAPIAFLASQYLSSQAQAVVKPIADALSVFLIVAVVFSYVLEWRSRLRAHQELLVRNLELAERLDRAQAEALAPEEMRLLEGEVTSVHSQDLNLLKKVSDSDKREAYRAVLQEDGADSVCPICKRSPWRFRKHRTQCQACGNALA